MPQLEHIEAIEKRLWGAADNLRANSTYASNEYFLPVMGLVFLRYAYSRYLSVKDRIEADYESLRGALPKSEYQELDNDVLGQLLRTLNPGALKQVSGDVFGRIYEYFLTQFADDKAHDDGEFFTPVSLVSLIAHVLEPNCGTVLDPACGSGGMFVQSARTVEEHGQHPTEQLTFRGIEKNGTTIRLARMNLAVHGLEGDIRQAITYYEDPHELLGKADYVMANPPFNVDEIDADKVKTDPRLPFGLPGVNRENKVSSGNYVWISYFYSYLNETGRAGFVMSSQASSAGGSEAAVRRKLVETGDIEAMIAIRSNFFYTRTVPCELWFLNRARSEAHRDKARTSFPEAIEQFRTAITETAQNTSTDLNKQVTEFAPLIEISRDLSERTDSLYKLAIRITDICETSNTINNRTDISRARRSADEARKIAVEQLKQVNYFYQQAHWLTERFPEAKLCDVEGLVKLVDRTEIEANDWSLTPGRYVGVAPEEEDENFDFAETLRKIHEELDELNIEAVSLAATIKKNFETLI